MARKSAKAEPWATANGETAFIMLHYSLIDSPAFNALSVRQVRLYLFAVRHRNYTVRELNGRGKGTAATSPAVRWCAGGNVGRDCFYLNTALGRASGIYTNEKTGKYDARGFKRDRAALVRIGFIDEVIPGAKVCGAEKAVYRMGERWKAYRKAREPPEN